MLKENKYDAVCTQSALAKYDGVSVQVQKTLTLGPLPPCTLSPYKAGSGTTVSLIWQSQSSSSAEVLNPNGSPISEALSLDIAIPSVLFPSKIILVFLFLIHSFVVDDEFCFCYLRFF